MANLAEKGLDLRYIDTNADIQKIVADINYIVRVISTNPGFLGLSSDPLPAIQPDDPERGSIWVLIGSEQFIENYDTILNAAQVTGSFLTAELQNDRETLMDTLGLETLVQGDTFILPSKRVVQYDIATGEFKDTGISFEETTTITEDDVRLIVNRMIGGLSNQTPVSGLYTAVGKNAHDSSGGQNVSVNPSSAIDPAVSGSGAGVDLEDYHFFGTREAYLPTTDSFQHVIGSMQTLHEIIQNTLLTKSVEYTSGVDNFHALTLLQNDFNSGIQIGSKTSEYMSTFAQIFQPSPSALRIQSKFKTDYGITMDNDNGSFYFADLVLSGTKTKLNATETQLVSNKRFYGDNFDFNASGTSVGKSGTGTTVKGDSLTLDIGLSESEFLSIDSNNKLVRQTLTTKSNALDTSNKYLITHNLVHDLKVSLENAINLTNDTLQDLIDVVGGTSAFVSLTTSPTDVNTNMNYFSEFGSKFLPKKVSGKAYTNVPNVDLNNQNITRSDEGWLNLYTSTNVDGSIELLQSYMAEKDTVGRDGRVLYGNYTRRGKKSATGSISWDTWRSDDMEQRIKDSETIELVQQTDGIFINQKDVERTDTTEEGTASGVNVVTGVTTNDKGHVTGVVKKAMPQVYSKTETNAIVSALVDSVIQKGTDKDYTPEAELDPTNKRYVDNAVGNVSSALTNSIQTLSNDLSALDNNVLKKNNTAVYTPSGNYNPTTVLWVRNEIASKLRRYVVHVATLTIKSLGTNYFSTSNISIETYNPNVLTSSEVNRIRAKRVSTGVYQLRHSLYSSIVAVASHTNIIPNFYTIDGNTVGITSVYPVTNDMYEIHTADDATHNNNNIRCILMIQINSNSFE